MRNTPRVVQTTEDKGVVGAETLVVKKVRGENLQEVSQEECGASNVVILPNLSYFITPHTYHTIWLNVYRHITWLTITATFGSSPSFATKLEAQNST